MPKLLYPSSMATKKRPDDQEVRVLRPIHRRLKALAKERKTWIGGLATEIIEAYLERVDAAKARREGR